MNIFKRIGCAAKGHVMDTDGNLIKGYILPDMKTYLFKCSRCGAFVLSDHNGSVVISKNDARKIIHDFDEDMLQMFEKKLSGGIFDD